VFSYLVGVGDGVTRVVEASAVGGCAGDDGAVAVLVHGVGSHSGWWSRNVSDLAGMGYRTLCIDLPGHGFAALQPGWPLTMPGYRDFLVAYLRSEVAKPALLVGHSLGGHVAAMAALDAPGLVSGLVLSAPTGLFPVGIDARRGTEARQTDFSREGIRRKLEFAVADRALVTDLWVEEDYRVALGPGVRDGIRAITRHIVESLNDFVVGGELGELASTVPTVVVWGSADRSVPMTPAVQRIVGPGRIEVVPDAGHVPHLETPGAFAEAVRSMGLSSDAPRSATTG